MELWFGIVGAELFCRMRFRQVFLALLFRLYSLKSIEDFRHAFSMRVYFLAMSTGHIVKQS